MTHQQLLDALIRSMMPSPALERHADWYKTNAAFLERRIERLKRVKNHLDRLPALTRKQRRIHKRYRNKITRLSVVQQQREHLAMVAALRVKRQVTRHADSVHSARAS